MQYLSIFSLLLINNILLILVLILPYLKNMFNNHYNASSTKIPILGSFFKISKNKNRYVQWTSDVVKSTPNLTFSMHSSFNRRIVITANAANVQHILKSNFGNYNKGDYLKSTIRDFMGDGIFNSDGEKWKFQRQISSHEFNTKSLKKFVETVVDYELSDRLIPILKRAANEKTVLDFQDILQRFTFDNICKIAFGYDPVYLLPSLPQAKFAVAFEESVKLSNQRLLSLVPSIWKLKRALNIGSEKRLKNSIHHVVEFAKQRVREKNKELMENSNSSLESVDLLSRFLSSGHSDEDFVVDIVISFILAGRDTTSAALTWFFWLISNHPEVENEILKEIDGKTESTPYDEVKGMIYTHASLCESMRLYPPVPIDTKEVVSDDILPDGTVVKKGMRISYHPYAMGRIEKVWGKDWAEFRPLRWLEKDEGNGKWSFVSRDPYTYPVFQAGPRICLGKEMAFLQMKRVVSGVLRRFKVVPTMEKVVEPVLITNFTGKMKGGLPVRVEVRGEKI